MVVARKKAAIALLNTRFGPAWRPAALAVQQPWHDHSIPAAFPGCFPSISVAFLQHQGAPKWSPFAAIPIAMAGGHIHPITID
jgi:hypothetical protein